MRKNLFLLIFMVFSMFCSFGQIKDHSHNHNKPQITRKLFSEKDLRGFDHKKAWDIAKTKSSKLFEQQEYFEALQRRYVYEKKGVGPQVQGRGNQKYTVSYDPLSKTTNVNLTPYSAYCPNAGFENGNFGNWQAYTFTNSTATNWNNFTPTWVNGVVTLGTNIPAQANWPGFVNPYPNRHTIMTIPPTVNNPPNACIGWDSICILPATHLSEVEFVPPTANGVTCRLGNANNNYNETERLVYTINVNQNNTQFTYSYAVVIYDGGHTSGEQPFFKITARDQFGNPIGGACGQYQIDATMVSTDPEFTAASYWASWNNAWVDPTPGGFNSYYYKKWTDVAIDLTAYIGTTVTIEFQTGDCIFGGHWAYAYVDATCQSGGSTVNFCTGGSSALLVGPPGYTSYTWYGPNNLNPVPNGTNDTLVINNAVIGDIYTLVAVSPAGCTSTFKDTIVVSNVSIQNTFSTPSCQLGNSGSVTVVAVGSSNGYNYSWTGPNGPIGGNSSTINGLSPGTYSVSVTAPNCGQYDTTVTVGLAPPVFYTQTQQFCLTPANVVAPSGSNYQWYGPNNQIIPTGTNNPLIVNNPIQGQSYTAVFTNAQGCRDSVKITLTQQVNVQTQNITFCGNTAILNAPSNSSNVSWYDANFPYSLIGSGPTITIQSPVTSTFQPYYYAYTNTITGCRDSVEVYLTQIAGSTFATSIQPTCPGQSTGSATININTTQLGPYSIQVNGVGYNANLTGLVTPTTNLTNLAGGTYSIIAQDAVCTYTGTFTINTIPVPVTVSVNPNCIVAGDTSFVSFSYGSGGSSGTCQSTPVNCASPSVVQVGFGAQQNTSTTWPSVYGNWYSNEKYQILYRAADLQAMGLTAGKFSNIAFQVASIPASMNTTFINYTIKIACTTVNDLGSGFGVPFVTAPFVTVWGPQTYTINTGWNTHNFTQAYEWDGVSNIIVEICYDWVASVTYTNNAISNNVTTPYNSYAVYYSDTQPACPATTTNQTYTSRPNTRFGHCVGQSQPSDYTYSWLTNPTNGLNNTPTSPTNTDTIVELIANGTTTVSLSITSNTGNCTIDTSFTINVTNPFNLSVFGDTVICSNSNPFQVKAFTTDPITGQLVPVSGVWSGTGLTDLGNGFGQFDPSVSGAGTFNLIYTAGTLACGAMSYKQDTVVIKVNQFLPATFNNFGPFCSYDVPTNLIPLSTNGLGQWFVNGTQTTTFNPSILGPSTGLGHEIKYVIDLGNGCPDSVTKYVDVFSKPQVTFVASDTAGCLPSLPVQFNSTVIGNQIGTYSWSFGNGFTSNLTNPIHIYNTTGIFTIQLQYTDQNGCKDTATENSYIQVFPIPQPNFTWNPNPANTLNPTVDFYNLTPNNAGLIWDWDIAGLTSSNTFNTTFNFPTFGIFPVTLTAINPFGCQASVTRPIVIEADQVVYIPSAFTPNDDGKNDYFIMTGDGYVSNDFEMSIYNRWGERIFETKDVTEPWKGDFRRNGIIVNNDVFVYKIQYRDVLGKLHLKTGHVTVYK